MKLEIQHSASTESIQMGEQNRLDQNYDESIQQYESIHWRIGSIINRFNNESIQRLNRFELIFFAETIQGFKIHLFYVNYTFKLLKFNP